MTAAVIEQVPAIGGSPAAIAESARDWRATADRCQAWAARVRACRAAEFDGDEAAQFGEIISRHADQLDAAAAAWRAGADTLMHYADRLGQCQVRIRALAECVPPPLTELPDGDASGPWGFERAIATARLEHETAVRECRVGLDAARTLLPAVTACAGVTLQPPLDGRVAPANGIGVTGIPAAGIATTDTAAAETEASDPRETWTSASIRTTAAALRGVAGQSGLLAATAPRPADLGDFFSEFGDLLSVAGTALAAFWMGGGGSGLALAGGAGAGAAVAAPEALAAAAGVAAGVGIGILVASAIEGESPGEVYDDLTHETVEGTPEADPHTLAQINRSRIPPDVLKEVDKAIERAKIDKKQFPGHDGEPWKNKWDQLPPAPNGYYTEWTAAPNGAGRGYDQPWRVIIAGDAKNPDAIYLWDHTRNPPIYIGP